MDSRARRRRGRRATADRRGHRGRRLGPARLRAALARGRAPRHRLVLRADPGRDRRSRGRQERRGAQDDRLGRLGLRRGAPPAEPAGPAAPAVHRRCGVPGLDSLAEFPPVADDKGVYIETAKGGVVALNPTTGKRRWTRQDRAAARDQPGARREAALYVSSLGGVVVALRRRDGKRLWRYRVGARTESSPLLVDGTLYFGAEDGTLTALNATNGHRRWRVHVGGAVKGSPAYSGGLLVVGSYDGHVYGFNARTGTRRWRTVGPRPLRRPPAGPLLLHADDRLRARLHRLDRRPRLLAGRLDGQDRLDARRPAATSTPGRRSCTSWC